MCGISGLVQRKNQPAAVAMGELSAGLSAVASDGRAAIDRMIASQKHRGPDGEGRFEGPGFFLGHNRLAILDLSPAGHQPMELSANDGRKLVLIYNGEIYNYLELRDELLAKGHKFRSESDTEVLLHAYQEWGADSLDRLNGMFAFVIYDSARNILFGARDRFGVKPLHLRMTADAFTFASEIKALLSVAPADGADRQTIVDYLYAGHIQHTGRTFFRGIEELKPGHRFTYDLRAHELKVDRWYDLRERVESNRNSDRGSGSTPNLLAASMTPQEAAEELKKLLTDSVRLRLRSDVRVGTCLSGGIDSSSIASLAAPLYGSNATKRHPAQAFIGITAQSLDLDNDESSFARAVVENSHLEWHKVRPLDFRDRMIDVVKTQDEPFAGLSVFMQDAVMSEARKLGVPVLLDGQGGDEVFLGYPKYLQARGWPPPPPRLFAKRLASTFGILETRKNEALFSETMQGELKVSRRHLLRYRRALSDGLVAQIMDITETNLPQLLRYEDRNSMRHSIETRLPFLDYRLVEFGLALPYRIKVANGVQKAVLRQAMRGTAPDTVLDRRDKIGFASPDRIWAAHFDELWKDHVQPSRFLADLIPTLATSKPTDFAFEERWKVINLALWASQVAKLD